MEEVSKEELIETLHFFQKEKIPSPDGWAIEFFIHCFDHVRHGLLKAVEESRRFSLFQLT